MIEEAIQRKLRSACEVFWAKHMKTSAFKTRVAGKESGHKIADWVEDETTQHIEKTYDPGLSGQESIVGYQRDKKNNPVARGIGDIWIYSNGIYNPVDIKTGTITNTQGKAIRGSPNLVALKKLLTAICERKIDSYYLLIVRFDLRKVSPLVHFVDLLDCLDYVRFDSGPGQIMLKQKNFYEAFDNNGVKSNTIGLEEKIKKLSEILKKGNAGLIENRKNTAKHLKEIAEKFNESEQIEQDDLNIGPGAK